MTWLGRYDLIDLIGRGGFGVVYRAVDRRTGAEVAVKTVRSTLVENVEITALRALRLPGIARLLDHGVEQDSTVIVQDFAPGTPFPGVTASWERVQDVLRRLLDTLERIHACGFLHLDLKPHNVLVDDEGRPTILDFGVARLQAAGPPGPLCGSPRYAAPEVWLGGAVSPATDLFSVGVMVAELFGGGPTFDDPVARLGLDPDAVPLDLPAAPSALLRRLLAPNPADRPSILQIRRELWPVPPGPVQFVGPDRIVRLRAEAAELLDRRSGGDPVVASAVVAEWVVRGYADVVGDGVRFRREGLDRAALPLWPPVGPTPPSDLTEVEGEVLEWIHLLAPRAIDAALRAAMGDRADGVGERLAARRLVVRRGDAWWALVTPPWREGRGDRHREAARIHVGPSPERLLHAWFGGDRVLAARDALALAGRAAHDGNPRRAVALLSEVAEWMWTDGEVAEASLLDTFSDVALRVFHPRLLERASTWLDRSGSADHALRALLEGATVAARGESHRALQLVAPVLRHPRWGARAMAVRVRAGLNDVSAMPALHAELVSLLPDADASTWNWAGLCAYREGRFDEALARHTSSFERAVTPSERMAASVNAAAAAVEGGRLAEAATWATVGASLADAAGNVDQRARAEVLGRAVAYRSGAAREPDEDLVDALSALGLPELLAFGALTEAAVAYRAGLVADAARLARLAGESYAHLVARAPTLLARALELAALGRPELVDGVADDVGAIALPRVRAQALALLARAASPDSRPALVAAARRAVSECVDPGHPLEVLALGECV